MNIIDQANDEDISDENESIKAEYDGTTVSQRRGSTLTRKAFGSIFYSCPHYNEYSMNRLYAKFVSSFSAVSEICSICDSTPLNHMLASCMECYKCVCIDFVSEKYNILSILSHQNSFSHKEGCSSTWFVELETGFLGCVSCNKWIWNHHLHYRWNNPTALAIGTKKTRALFRSSWKAHCIALRGLANLGHTCYMNAILQVLLHIHPFQKHLMTSRNLPTCSCKARTKVSTSSCIYSEMIDFFGQMYSGELTPFVPIKLLAHVWRACPSLAGYQQQDSHEFLIELLDALHTCNSTGTDLACQCFIHKLFGGMLRSEVKCLRCSTTNVSFDPFIDLSLDIYFQSDGLTSASANLIDDCLAHFTRVEKLAGKAYKCANCSGSLQAATKQMLLHSLPECLVIQIKRFAQRGTEGFHSNTSSDSKMYVQPSVSTSQKRSNQINGTTPTTAKIDQHVSFPTELHLSDNSHFLSYYALEGVIEHIGQTLEGGHYIAYLTHRDCWFRMDDALITRVESIDVLNSKAYMLFYTRIKNEK